MRHPCTNLLSSGSERHPCTNLLTSGTFASITSLLAPKGLRWLLGDLDLSRLGHVYHPGPGLFLDFCLFYSLSPYFGFSFSCLFRGFYSDFCLFHFFVFVLFLIFLIFLSIAAIFLLISASLLSITSSSVLLLLCSSRSNGSYLAFFADLDANSLCRLASHGVLGGDRFEVVPPLFLVQGAELAATLASTFESDFDLPHGGTVACALPGVAQEAQHWFLLAAMSGCGWRRQSSMEPQSSSEMFEMTALWTREDSPPFDHSHFEVTLVPVVLVVAEVVREPMEVVRQLQPDFSLSLGLSHLIVLQIYFVLVPAVVIWPTVATRLCSCLIGSFSGRRYWKMLRFGKPRGLLFQISRLLGYLGLVSCRDTWNLRGWQILIRISEFSGFFSRRYRRSLLTTEVYLQ